MPCTGRASNMMPAPIASTAEISDHQKPGIWRAQKVSLMDIMISFFIIAGLPGSALWAIGLMVGINLLIGGTALIGMALAARNNGAA